MPSILPFVSALRGFLMVASVQIDMLGIQHSVPTAGAQSEECVPLENEGPAFVVDTCLGTPPQCFKVIADTGSNAIVVPSCACHNSGGCSSQAKCFSDHQSSTYSVAEPPVLNNFTYGQGTVEVLQVTDVAKLGSLAATMQNKLFLMTNMEALAAPGDFQGLIGLGVPTNFDEESGAQFMKAAHVDRYSLCFRDSGEAGALRSNVPPFANPIRHQGTFNWGMDFRGMSVGPKGSTEHHEIILCGEDTMTAGMHSPCGIVPDSGTTLMIGPRAQVMQLERSICDAWPRCKNATDRTGADGSDAFHSLLQSCSSWLDSGDGIYEVPSLFFLLQGAGGQKMSFELTAWAYIVWMEVHGKPMRCDTQIGYGADMSGSDWVTEDNGPIWIFGTPLFYEYTVGFDISSQAMSLDKGSCSRCGGALSAAPSELRRHGQPRIGGKPRRGRHYNTSMPL